MLALRAQAFKGSGVEVAVILVNHVDNCNFFVVSNGFTRELLVKIEYRYISTWREPVEKFN